MNDLYTNSTKCFWCGRKSVFTAEVRPNEPQTHWSKKLELICRDCFFDKDRNKNEERAL